MTPQDTHCSRCGGRLSPTPSFTAMLWLCPCGGQTKPQAAESLGWSLLAFYAKYGPGTVGRIISVQGKMTNWVIGTTIRMRTYHQSMDIVEFQVLNCPANPGLNGAVNHGNLDGYRLELIQ